VMMSDNLIHKSQGIIIYTDIELHFASITYTILSVLLVSFFFFKMANIKSKQVHINGSIVRSTVNRK
jgi:hypothetical protein